MHFSHQRYSANECSLNCRRSAKSFSELSRRRSVVWDIASVGIILVFIGFAVVAAALLRSAKSSGSEVRGAAVIMIGPIPLVFGSDAKWASIAMALAIVLVLLVLLLYVF